MTKLKNGKTEGFSSLRGDRIYGWNLARKCRPCPIWSGSALRSPTLLQPFNFNFFNPSSSPSPLRPSPSFTSPFPSAVHALTAEGKGEEKEKICQYCSCSAMLRFSSFKPLIPSFLCMSFPDQSQIPHEGVDHAKFRPNRYISLPIRAINP